MDQNLLSMVEAAHALGVSVSSLRRHVLPDLACVRIGRRVLIPVVELHRYQAQNQNRFGRPSNPDKELKWAKSKGRPPVSICVAKRGTSTSGFGAAEFTAALEQLTGKKPKCSSPGS